MDAWQPVPSSLEARLEHIPTRILGCFSDSHVCGNGLCYMCCAAGLAICKTGKLLDTQDQQLLQKASRPQEDKMKQLVKVNNAKYGSGTFWMDHALPVPFVINSLPCDVTRIY